MPTPDDLIPETAQHPGPLPAMPALRRDVAVIARPRQPLLIAASARHVVQVVAPPAGLAEWLAGLDGSHDVAQAVAAAPLPLRDAYFLLRELDRAGLLTDANHGHPFRSRATASRDGLRLAAQARDGAVRRSRPRPEATAVGISGDRNWVPVLEAALVGCPEQVRLSTSTDPALLVTIGTTFADGSASARSRAMAGAIPHLDVTVSAFDAVLSPLTVPGRTACYRCWTLRTDRRSGDWAEWTFGGRTPEPPRPPAHHRALIVALAAEHTLAAVDVLRGRLAPGSAELERVLDLRTATVRARPVGPHPACGCIALAA